MPIQDQRLRWILLLLIFAVGVLADFLMIGVLKIIWIAIYAPTYLALAMTIETWVSKRYQNLSRKAVYAFIAGAILAHIAFAGRQHERDFSMRLLVYNPLQLQAQEFPEFLFLESPDFEKLVVQKHLTENILVRSIKTTDYGCLSAFNIESVGGVDIGHDPHSSWTFRMTAPGSFSNPSPPLLNEEDPIWCKLRFYRSKK